MPRERLLREGPSVLTSQELWQCVLGWGKSGYPVKKLASQVDSLLRHWVVASSQPNLPTQLGPAQTARVLAILELAHRWQQLQSTVISSPKEALQWCHDIRSARTERLLALYCGANGEVLHREVLAMGSMNTVVIQPRDLFRPVTKLPVDSIVLCHNHPSGNPQPSTHDEIFTARMEAACRIMGLWLRDHLVVTSGEYFSFREAGRLTSGVSQTES